MPATLILVEGEPGVGKSTAWEKMPHEESVVITPNSKDLPFEGSATKYPVGTRRLVTNKLTDLPIALKKVNDEMPHVKYVLVDDFTHYFNARTMDPQFIARKLGNDAFAKWNEFAADVFKVIGNTIESFRSDLWIVMNAHTEVNGDGQVVLQLPGKLLENSIKVASYFTYIFHAMVRQKENEKIEYCFLTNRDGIHEAKTPKGCFKDLYIPNDLKFAIDTIRQYKTGTS